MNRVKTYFDHETRKVIRASNKIIRLCRFKQDNDILAEGLRSILKELNGEISENIREGVLDVKESHQDVRHLRAVENQSNSKPFNQKGDMYE